MAIFKADGTANPKWLREGVELLASAEDPSKPEFCNGCGYFSKPHYVALPKHAADSRLCNDLLEMAVAMASTAKVSADAMYCYLVEKGIPLPAHRIERVEIREAGKGFAE